MEFSSSYLMKAGKVTPHTVEATLATVIVGPKVKKAFRSSQFDQHQNVLRTALDALGIHHYPGQSATAVDMNVF